VNIHKWNECLSFFDTNVFIKGKAKEEKKAFFVQTIELKHKFK